MTTKKSSIGYTKPVGPLTADVLETPAEIFDNKPIPPDDLFKETLETLANLKPPSDNTDKEVYNLEVPKYRPWKGSGRLVCQAFKRVSRAGVIEIVAAEDPHHISKNTVIFCVAKDEELKGINVLDEVVFADEFVPTSKILEGRKYYVPHYLDVMLIFRENVMAVQQKPLVPGQKKRRRN